MTNVNSVEQSNLRYEWALLRKSVKPEESFFSKLIDFIDIKHVQIDQVNYQQQVNEFIIYTNSAFCSHMANLVRPLQFTRNKGLKFGCWLYGNNHQIREYTVFIKMDSQLKIENLRKHGVCFCSLYVGDTRKNCPNKRFWELKGEGKETLPNSS